MQTTFQLTIEGAEVPRYKTNYKNLRKDEAKTQFNELLQKITSNAVPHNDATFGKLTMLGRRILVCSNAQSCKSEEAKKVKAAIEVAFKKAEITYSLTWKQINNHPKTKTKQKLKQRKVVKQSAVAA